MKSDKELEYTFNNCDHGEDQRRACLGCVVECLYYMAQRAATAAPAAPPRSNHFDDAAIDKGMFPNHIARDGTAHYRDGSVLPPAAPRGEARQDTDAWKTAAGIRYHNGETNPALAERDYSVRCKTPLYPIAIHEGYHFWWCEPHHQPLYACEIALEPAASSAQPARDAAREIVKRFSDLPWPTTEEVEIIISRHLPAASQSTSDAARRLSSFLNEDYTLIAKHFKDTSKDRGITGDVEELVASFPVVRDDELVNAFAGPLTDDEREIVERELPKKESNVTDETNDR